MKKYYALYNSYGIRTAYNEYNCPIVHIFASAEERNAWVGDEADPFNPKREAVTAQEVRRYINSAQIISHIQNDTNCD